MNTENAYPDAPETRRMYEMSYKCRNYFVQAHAAAALWNEYAVAARVREDLCQIADACAWDPRP